MVGVKKIFKVTELKEGFIYKSTKENTKYKIENNKLFYQSNGFRWWIESSMEYNYLLKMDFLEVPFEPKAGDFYYFPTLHTKKGYMCHKWSGNHEDKLIQKITGTYRTREEAIEKAKEWGWL